MRRSRVAVGPAIRKYVAPRKLKAYRKRNHRLESLGQGKYHDYLESALWESIRRRVLDRDKRTCRICGERATLVHHNNYSTATLQGETLIALMSLCHGCHQFIEFNKDGTKAALCEVRRRTKLLLKIKGRAGVNILNENQRWEQEHSPKKQKKEVEKVLCIVCGKLKRYSQMYSRSSTCIVCGNERKRRGLDAIAGHGVPVT